MSTRKQYLREVQDNIDYLPTWLPTVKVAAGDIGVILDYEFRHLGSLKDIGISYKVIPGIVQADIEYSSSGAVSSVLKAAGQTAPSGSALSIDEAGISFDFARTAAVVFRAVGCKSERIDNLLAVGKHILAKYQAGQWPKDTIVVTEAVHASHATIIICSGEKGHLDLRVASKVIPVGLHIASSTAEFQIVREINIGTKIIAQSGLTPLMRTSGVKKRLLREPVFRGTDSLKLKDTEIPADDDPSIRFVNVGYEDYDVT